MSRRNIFIIIGLVVLLILGGAIFWLTRKSSPEKSTSTALALKKISDDQVIAPISGLDNNSVWYFRSDGRLFRVGTDGTGLTEFPITALNGQLYMTYWPAKGSDYLISALSAASPPTKFLAYYNSKSKIYVTLPNNIQSIDWMPDGQRVIYVWKSGDGKSYSLVTADADGSGFTKVSDLTYPDLQVKASPDGKTALLYHASNPNSDNKIYLVDLGSGVITTVVESGNNTGAVWLPSGQGFVYAQAAQSVYPSLFLYDLATKKSTDLKLSTSLDRITIDSTSQYIYAAVAGPGSANDQFVMLHLSDNSQVNYFKPNTAVRASDLILVGHTLYFINGNDGKLYSVQ